MAPEKELYLPGETVRVRLDAHYYFGGPVKERTFSWARLQGADWDSDNMDDEEGEHGDTARW